MGVMTKNAKIGPAMIKNFFFLLSPLNQTQRRFAKRFTDPTGPIFLVYLPFRYIPNQYTKIAINQVVATQG
jgi:hypothetical protein